MGTRRDAEEVVHLERLEAGVAVAVIVAAGGVVENCGVGAGRLRGGSLRCGFLSDRRRRLGAGGRGHEEDEAEEQNRGR